MGLFPQSLGNLYVLIYVDYVSKGLEALSTPTNCYMVGIKFLIKNILYRHGTPRAIIRDKGTHFCNKYFKYLMKNMGLYTRLLLPTILKVVRKLNCLIRRKKEFWKMWLTLLRRTGQNIWMILFGPT